MYMWGDHMIPIPYKVWGDHESHITHEDTSHFGRPDDTCSYKVWGDHMIPIPYKVWGP